MKFRTVTVTTKVTLLVREDTFASNDRIRNSSILQGALKATDEWVKEAASATHVAVSEEPRVTLEERL
jgi:hypothetical protein